MFGLKIFTRIILTDTGRIKEACTMERAFFVSYQEQTLQGFETLEGFKNIILASTISIFFKIYMFPIPILYIFIAL